MRTNPVRLRDKIPPRIRALVEIARTGVTSSRLWQVVFSETDTEKAEIFGPLGYQARPRPEGARALVVRAGDGRTTHVIAFSDPGARLIELAEDERAIANQVCQLVLHADGTIEARSAAGTAVALATKADVQAVRDALHGHAHMYQLDGVPTSTTGNPSVPSPAGTQVFMAE